MFRTLLRRVAQALSSTSDRRASLLPDVNFRPRVEGMEDRLAPATLT